MKIIKSYWADKAQELKTESEIKNYLENNEIKTLYIGERQIKNFRFDFDGRFVCRFLEG